MTIFLAWTPGEKKKDFSISSFHIPKRHNTLEQCRVNFFFILSPSGPLMSSGFLISINSLKLPTWPMGQNLPRPITRTLPSTTTCLHIILINLSSIYWSNKLDLLRLRIKTMVSTLRKPTAYKIQFLHHPKHPPIPHFSFLLFSNFHRTPIFLIYKTVNTNRWEQIFEGDFRHCLNKNTILQYF